MDELLESNEEGRVVLDLLRGRSGLSPAAQAAEHFLRRDGRLVAGERIALAGLAGGAVLLETADGRRHSVELAVTEGARTADLVRRESRTVGAVRAAVDRGALSSGAGNTLTMTSVGSNPFVGVRSSGQADAATTRSRSARSRT